jgi:hypothetical protein
MDVGEFIVPVPHVKQVKVGKSYPWTLALLRIKQYWAFAVS